MYSWIPERMTRSRISRTQHSRCTAIAYSTAQTIDTLTRHIDGQIHYVCRFVQKTIYRNSVNPPQINLSSSTEIIFRFQNCLPESSTSGTHYRGHSRKPRTEHNTHTRTHTIVFHDTSRHEVQSRNRHQYKKSERYIHIELRSFSFRVKFFFTDFFSQTTVKL